MARQLRLEYAGAVYHVMARGDRREDIVTSEKDRQLFLDTLEEVCAMTGWRVHAWVLMSNHYHWVIATPEPNLVAGMKWFQNTYTRHFNSRHKLWGHVFGGRYKSILVEGGAYFNGLVDYVHLNPVRAGLVKTGSAQELLDYSWSSLSRGYAAVPAKRPSWLQVSERLGLGAQEERAKHRQDYLRYLHGMAREEGRQAGKILPDGQSLHSTLQRGWFWGSEAFRKKLLKRLGKRRSQNTNYRTSPLAKEQNRQDAEAWITSGLKQARLRDTELKTLKGSHPAKVAIAVALKNRTIAGNAWIAQRLHMRSAGNVSQLARRYKQGEISLSQEMKAWLDLSKMLA